MALCWFRGEHDIPKLGRDRRVSRATTYREVEPGSVHDLTAARTAIHPAAAGEPGTRIARQAPAATVPQAR